ncbi:ficolin-2-like isoform X2 [Oscarella lobularis]|uniref:ficolin-2-like isoform X2 n=1 Tax=Oscarella lobularis TaxID=121494 RepID=UPI0033138212
MKKKLLFCLLSYLVNNVSSQTSSTACDHKHIVGPQGLPGPVGPQGLPGTIGSSGPPGPVGRAGPTGERGILGPRGLKGDKGDRGYTGVQGKIGNAGAKGDKGNRGFSAVGPKGDKGQIGQHGHKGQKGERGIQDLSGVVPSNTIESLQNQLQDLQKIVRSFSCDCSCLHKRYPHLSSGSYTISFVGIGLVPIYCDMETDGGGWTVFQRRKDGSVDFNRGWDDYERGFGNLSGDYWLGLAPLHQLLQLNGANELRIDLKDYSGNSAYAKYSNFNVEDSSSNYTLNVTGYSGTAGDAMAGNSRSAENVNGMKFSTKDEDNDNDNGHCAARYKGGWWCNSCHYTFLNGLYGRGSGYNHIVWYTWKQKTSLSFSEMKFRKRG